jgi:hypothetical protein
MGEKRGWEGRAGRNGFGETLRMKMVKDWKGGEVKRVEEREASGVEKSWVRRSKMAIWWINLWMRGTSDALPRCTRANTIGWGCPAHPQRLGSHPFTIFYFFLKK